MGEPTSSLTPGSNPRPIGKQTERAIKAANTRGTYIVKQGDSIWNIARSHFKLPTNENILAVSMIIADVNKLKDPNLIQPGQKLIIPSLRDIAELSLDKAMKFAFKDNMSDKLYAWRTVIEKSGIRIEETGQLKTLLDNTVKRMSNQ